MRIVRVLEARAHEHFRTFAEDVDRAVAVVHVEIEDRDALDAGLRQCDLGTECDVVEETKPHRLIFLGVVSRRADRAERAPRLALQYEVDRIAHGTGGEFRGVHRHRAQAGIGVEVCDAVARNRGV